MRGSVDLKLWAMGADWPMPYRLRYYTGETEGGAGPGSPERLVGWGHTIGEAIVNLCLDPRSSQFDDLAGYLCGALGQPAVFIPQPPPARDIELPLEAGTKRGELLNSVEDPHNLFALVQWWPRGESIKFRAEACGPEPEVQARYEADLEMYFGTNIARITMPRKPVPRIFEFCVPAALVTSEVRFFYRTPEAFYFFRENNPYTSLDAYDFDIPIEGVTLLL